MSRGKLWKIIGIAVFVIDAILILVNISNLMSYGTAEAEVTKTESHLDVVNYSHRIGSSKDKQLIYNYVRYTVNGTEYENFLIGDCGAAAGDTITVRYKQSDPSVLLELHKQKPVSEINIIGIIVGALCLVTSFIFDKADERGV